MLLAAAFFVACHDEAAAPPTPVEVETPKPTPPPAPKPKPKPVEEEVAPPEPVLVPPALGAVCDPHRKDCLCCVPCCLPDAQPVCTAPGPQGRCPEPDLVVDGTLVKSSLQPSSYDAKPDGCGMQMGCVGGTGKRKVLRFTTSTQNAGTGTFYLGKPQDWPDRFKWFQCEQNYRYEGYTEFRLRDKSGKVVAAGKKDGYCLMDAMNVAPGQNPTYTCANQGISPGWADIYANGDDCEWVDVTDVAPGDYTLEVTVDPHDQWKESNEKNNTVRVPVHLEP